MSALSKLFRTTAFKLAVAYSIIFAVAASIVVMNVGRNVRGVLEDQISETIDADIRGLSDQYAQGGVQQVVQSIERRIRQPGGDIYLLTTFAGDSIVGNVSSIPITTLSSDGLIETTYQRPGEKEGRRRALVRVFVLPGNYRLLVGHDVEEVERLRKILRRALSDSLIWLVLIGAIAACSSPAACSTASTPCRNRLRSSCAAIYRGACQLPAPATRSIVWPKISTPCCRVSKLCCAA